MSGNKIKPHKGLQKRLRIGGKGTLLRKRAGKGHLMSSKTGKRRRRLRRTVGISSADVKRLRKMLGMA